MLEYTTVLIHIIFLTALYSAICKLCSIVCFIEFLYVYCHFILPLLIFNDTIVFCNIKYYIYIYIHVYQPIMLLWVSRCLNRAAIIRLVMKQSYLHNTLWFFLDTAPCCVLFTIVAMTAFRYKFVPFVEEMIVLQVDNVEVFLPCKDYTYLICACPC